MTKELNEIVQRFSTQLGVAPDYNVKSRPDGDYLVFNFAYPSDRLFAALDSINSELPSDHPFKDKITISQRTKKPRNVVDIPETKMLQRELSESLTVDRNTFGADFFSRYTASVTNFENRIVERQNFVVYGRRGSGKSSLLSYAMHCVNRDKLPYAWIAMQTYSGRNDFQAIASIISEIFTEFSRFAVSPAEFSVVAQTLSDYGEANSKSGLETKLNRLAPRLRKMLGAIAAPERHATIFLDDLHALSSEMQPVLLSFIWGLCRGNNIYIKCSGIEQFTKTWISSNRIGLEPPHDTQILKLDHNLTMPDRSLDHIKGILEAHARYCGLPNIAFVANDGVIDRLVLVAAAVPRDALSLFSQAITRSSMKQQTQVSITSVNAAASETIEEKLKDVDRDAHGEDAVKLRDLLERIRSFCVSEQRKNAFLVKIHNQKIGFQQIQKLIALRFVHVLHEGITPHKAGERYIALMLDYGFYIGIRAARSVELYPDVPKQLSAKELRTLPIFDPSAK